MYFNSQPVTTNVIVINIMCIFFNFNKKFLIIRLSTSMDIYGDTCILII